MLVSTPSVSRYVEDTLPSTHSIIHLTSRVQLGYWIIEALVNRETEFYPRGGIKQLVTKQLRINTPTHRAFQRRGLKQLQNAGIHAILDHHGLPGVQSAGQQFTGRYGQISAENFVHPNFHDRCTSDVEFYVSRETLSPMYLYKFSHPD